MKSTIIHNTATSTRDLKSHHLLFFPELPAATSTSSVLPSRGAFSPGDDGTTTAVEIVLCSEQCRLGEDGRGPLRNSIAVY